MKLKSTFVLFVFTLATLILTISARSTRRGNNDNNNSNNGQKDKDSLGLTSEPNSKIGDPNQGISVELQMLRELASQESGTIIFTTRKPKRTHSHSRNKHHGGRRNKNRRRGGHGHRRKGMRPSDLLKEEEPATSVQSQQSQSIPDISSLARMGDFPSSPVRSSSRESRKLKIAERVSSSLHHHSGHGIHGRRELHRRIHKKRNHLHKKHHSNATKPKSKSSDVGTQHSTFHV